MDPHLIRSISDNSLGPCRSRLALEHEIIVSHTGLTDIEYGRIGKREKKIGWNGVGCSYHLSVVRRTSLLVAVIVVRSSSSTNYY